MTGLLAKLVKIPGCTAFVLAYRKTGDRTALLAMCDWLDEHFHEYAPQCLALRAALREATGG